MEEQFILRVPPSVAERLDNLLAENPAVSVQDIDLSLQDGDGTTGTFKIGEDEFPVSLVDLPCVVESFKTFDDSVLIKSADVGQMILVREPGEAAPEGPEYKDGLTPAMRDARRRRFRREPDISSDYVQQVENDLQSIMAGGNARNVDVEVVEQEEDEVAVEGEGEGEAMQEDKAITEAAAVPPPVVGNKSENMSAEDADDTSADEAEYYEDDFDNY